MSLPECDKARPNPFCMTTDSLTVTFSQAFHRVSDKFDDCHLTATAGTNCCTYLAEHESAGGNTA